MRDEVSTGIGSRVARIIALSWLIAVAVYLGTCAAYRPLGFEAIQASRFSFLVTSAICLAALIGVSRVLARAKPGAVAAVLYLGGALTSAVVLSLVMDVCSTP